MDDHFKRLQEIDKTYTYLSPFPARGDEDAIEWAVKEIERLQKELKEEKGHVSSLQNANEVLAQEALSQWVPVTTSTKNVPLRILASTIKIPNQLTVFQKLDDETQADWDGWVRKNCRRYLPIPAYTPCMPQLKRTDG